MRTCLEPPRCWICGSKLTVQITRSRRGRHALGFSCPVDGRHVRGFINDADFLARVTGGTHPLDVPPQALQNRFEAALAQRPKEQSTAP